MTDLYDILKANRLKKESDPWLCILGEAWRASEEDYKEYTGLVPYTFIGNGQPFISWIIKGNTVQSGTPTHDNPIMPQGTGERTGNLFDESNFALIQVTTTAYRYGTSLGVLSQGTYTFNATKSVGAQSIYLTAKLNGVYSQTTISSVPFSFTADGESEYIIRTANNTGTTWEAENYSDMMLNLGSTPLPYEPYGVKIPISSAEQTTPVYLGEVETTRRIKKLVLTGEETLASGSVIGQIRTPLTGAINSLGLCTHYIIKTSYGGAFPYFRIANNVLWFELSPDGYETKEEALADFKSYLAQQYAAGTPVTVWYVLATEETAVVNEPLMKIGEYADSISDVVSIPTVRGENVFDVDTEVKPSEVYIKYKSR